MAVWGSSWGLGFPWGVGPAGEFESADCELAKDRLLMQHRGLSTDNLLRLACIVGKVWGNVRDEAAATRDAFVLDAAVGDQLDKIGSLVDLARNSLDDDEYRKFLRIQVLLISDSTGSGENILEILRTYLGPTVNPITLINSPPYHFTVTSLDMLEDDWDTMIPILRKALIAGVLGTAIGALAGSIVWGSQTAGAPIVGTGVWDSQTAGAPIVGTGVWGYQIIFP